MLDTKNFVLKTGVRTFEASAYLRRRGADTVSVKKLFSNTLDSYKRKAAPAMVKCPPPPNSSRISCTFTSPRLLAEMLTSPPTLYSTKEAFTPCMEKGISHGKLLLPTAAVRDEGLSYHYLPAAEEVELDPRDVQACREAMEGLWILRLAVILLSFLSSFRNYFFIIFQVPFLWKEEEVDLKKYMKLFGDMEKIKFFSNRTDFIVTLMNENYNRMSETSVIALSL